MFVKVVLMCLLPLCAVCDSHIHDKSQIHDKGHLKQHVDGNVDLDKMSDDELSFHYFKVHDVEGNGKLDGIELLQSLLHFHVDESSTYGFQPRSFSDDELSMIIDPVLKSEDRNSDGFIDYAEFVLGQISKDY